MVREEHRLGEIQNRVPRNKEWRQLHDEELHSYFSPIIIQVINKTEWNEMSMWYYGSAHSVLVVENLKYVRTYGKPWRRCDKNIKMQLKQDRGA